MWRSGRSGNLLYTTLLSKVTTQRRPRGNDSDPRVCQVFVYFIFGPVVIILEDDPGRLLGTHRFLMNPISELIINCSQVARQLHSAKRTGTTVCQLNNWSVTNGDQEGEKNYWTRNVQCIRLVDISILKILPIKIFPWHTVVNHPLVFIIPEHSSKWSRLELIQLHFTPCSSSFSHPYFIVVLVVVPHKLAKQTNMFSCSLYNMYVFVLGNATHQKYIT